MTNDLKLGFQIMKYGHAAKLTYIGSAVVLVIGVCFSILSCIAGGCPGRISFLFREAISCRWWQCFSCRCSLPSARLIWCRLLLRRRLQTSVPAVMSITLMMAGYLFSALILGITCLFHPEAVNSAAMQMIADAVLSGIVMVYYGACYKYFYTSTILFLIAFFFLYDFGFRPNTMLAGILPADGSWAGWGLALVLGAALILACGFLQYLISLAVYKAPVSKMALGAKLRVEM